MIYYLRFAKKGAIINKIRDRPFFIDIFLEQLMLFFFIYKKGEKNDKKY